MNSTILKKAGLELLRLIAFALPGILIVVFTNNPELGGTAGVIILAVLKAIDRGIHEDEATEAKGILPF